ncbi:hypothetical protein KC19_11G031000 [Ceratodon purpureus]|uniref:Uncharacterized protein n=1 Tax=Ceratodon purpureus TaxID=3225 RepID=A0A8T0GG53_CERPU|nr:hypothetical protein KC19_11G031000 [Ceratodon purpureus]
MLDRADAEPPNRLTELRNCCMLPAPAPSVPLRLPGHLAAATTPAAPPSPAASSSSSGAAAATAAASRHRQHGQMRRTLI